MDQLLLNIHPSRQKTLENFVVGKNNECLNSIKKLMQSNNFFFIYIWGAEGCGKTHLATALKKHHISVIEDVHKFNNEQQVKLFNVFNAAKKNNNKLIVTGSNSPMNMGLRDDLASRLSWHLVYQLKPLLDDEKKIALAKYAEGIGVSLDDKVISYCMRNLKRDLPYLIATVEALSEWSLKSKKPITVPLLKQLLLS